MTSITIDRREWELAQREIHDLRSLLGYVDGEYGLVNDHGKDPRLALDLIYAYAQKTLRKRQENFERVMTPPKACTERIWHGPGHQSSTRCDLRGEHDVHETHYGEFNQYAKWRMRPNGKETFSGVFDEPPSFDE